MAFLIHSGIEFYYAGPCRFFGVRSVMEEENR
jgi:hypothetical protein